MSQALQEYEVHTNIPLHKDIRFHADLTYGEKMFYAEIQSMSKCPFSSRKLGEFFGVSHQTILNWVKKLVDLDLLEVGVDYKNKDCRQFLKTKQQ
jgi:DNA-binding MarR family transcriptional regulator